MKADNTGVRQYSIADIYSDAGLHTVNPDFFVFTSSQFKSNDNIERRRPARSAHFTFLLILKGEGHIRLNLIDYRLPANTLFIITPALIHEFLEPSDDIVVTGMGFTTSFLDAVGMPKKNIEAFKFLSSQNIPHILLSDEEVATLHSLMLLLQQKNLNRNQNPFGTDILHYAFIMYMLEMGAMFMRQRTGGKMKMTRKEDILMSFIKMLTIHFKEERSVHFYADALYLTPKHLTKTVKEITGRTCGEFIDQMVITEAKILLNDLSHSIGQVADMLHFSDQFFFSKFFKQHTGFSPSEYKTTM